MNAMNVPLFQPAFGNEAVEAVRRVMASGWVGLGPEVERFEQEFASSVGAKYGVATNSCTAALQLALMCHDIGFPEEVIVPSLTFASTAHAVRMVGAEVEFADVLDDTLCLDMEDVKRRVTPATEAIVAVAYSGTPIDYGSDLDGIPIIYDCAHAAGSGFDAGDKTACWSFHAVKNLACGDGGMLTTDDSQIAERARRLRWLGIDKSTWERNQGGYSWEYRCHEIGIKGHMNDIAAAIGLAQLARLPEMQDRRREIARQYHRRFDGADLVVPEMANGHGWHLYVVRADWRDDLHRHLKARGVDTSVHYQPLHTHECYRWSGSLPVTDKVAGEILSLPIHPGLTDQQVDYVCESVEEFYA